MKMIVPTIELNKPLGKLDLSLIKFLASLTSERCGVLLICAAWQS